MPLPSSFWVDEMATVFVVQHGPADPSLEAAPQVAQSIYYSVARASDSLFGQSEIGYRAPSILFMAIAILLIARIAARLIHPQASWFVAFACLGLRGFNYEAANARPYALGLCVAAAGVFFLVRWLDSARWLDAAMFVIFAALLWRVHLILWPIYIVFACYAIVRLIRQETPVGWLAAGAIFALVALALVPVLLNAIALEREAKAHVVVGLPSLRALIGSFKLGLLAACGGGALLLGIWWRGQADRAFLSASALTLIAGWWLWHPLCLFGFSWLSGNSVFVPRYLSLSLPGAALAATALAAVFLPSTFWKPAAFILGAGVLLLLGQWTSVCPRHHNSDWRAAARAINDLPVAPRTPVVCPSPFIEAKPPVWRPDYPLPGFLYSHLPVYPVHGDIYLFPFEDSAKAEQYATVLSEEKLAPAGRFVIYGGRGSVRFWRHWFEARPEFSGWRERSLGSFADVNAVLFERVEQKQRAANESL